MSMFHTTVSNSQNSQSGMVGSTRNGWLLCEYLSPFETRASLRCHGRPICEAHQFRRLHGCLRDCRQQLFQYHVQHTRIRCVSWRVYKV